MHINWYNCDEGWGRGRRENGKGQLLNCLTKGMRQKANSSKEHPYLCRIKGWWQRLSCCQSAIYLRSPQGDAVNSLIFAANTGAYTASRGWDIEMNDQSINSQKVPTRGKDSTTNAKSWQNSINPCLIYIQNIYSFVNYQVVVSKNPSPHLKARGSEGGVRQTLHKQYMLAEAMSYWWVVTEYDMPNGNVQIVTTRSWDKELFDRTVTRRQVSTDWCNRSFTANKHPNLSCIKGLG